MPEEICAIWTTNQAQKVTLNMTNVPRGKSWCSYQRDQVTGLNTNIPTKAPLPDATLDVVKPAFTRLASVPFLEQCKNCRNQDANESFNSVVVALT